MIVAISSAAWLAGGCENKIDTTPNKLNSGDVAQETASDVASAGCDCLQVGMAWRFVTLQLDSIDHADHLVQGALNPLWKKDIQAYELNFFAEIKAVSATEVTVRIVNAARLANTKSELCLLKPTETTVVFPRQGCSLGPSATSAMNVYAGTPANPKNCAPKLPYPEVTHVIPVRGAVLSALVSEDCSQLHDGLVSAGHLPKSALAVTCTCLTTGTQTAETCGTLDPAFAANGCGGCNKKYQNLLTLLKSFSGEKQDLEYLCKEGDDPAACLTASFTGEKVAGLPGLCTGT